MSHLTNQVFNLLSIKNRIKFRLGELWWYTIVLFFAQQLGAVINAFVGLWLIPQYVPQTELGAVLPLTSVGGLIGLPLAILMMPFLKFLSKYVAQEEYGKVKALLRDVFVLTMITFVLVSGAAYFFMPFVFQRMRVENGSLSLLIVCSGVIGALAPVFSTALQALKKFRVMSMLGFAGAIVRLMTLWIVLPIRGLSGYFLGQIVPLFFGIVASIFVLRKHVGKTVKVASYWSEDWVPILRFTVWNAVLYSVGQLMGTTEGFVIRHRLSDMESAGYYMISRFAEITLCISMASSVVLFPLVSESHEKGMDIENRLLTQSSIISLFSGVFFTLAMTSIVPYLFVLKSDWAVYLPFIPHMFVLCLIQAIRGSTHCFVIYKTAKNEFGFIPFYVAVFASESIILYGLTGFTFFAAWLPSAWFQALKAFDPCRLWVVLGVILVHSLAIVGYVSTSMVRIQLRNRACPVDENQRLS